MPDAIAILDFGSQYSQLIARRVRELQVYCELFVCDAPPETVSAIKPRGFILSGGPCSVYDQDAPQLPEYVLKSGLPVLGICYGMQLLARELGGNVAASSVREYGPSVITTLKENALLPSGTHPVWMSHGDRIESLPSGFEILAKSSNSPVAAMGDPVHRRYGLQFHPEVVHTPIGLEILGHFVREICGCKPEWTPTSIIKDSVKRIRAQVGRRQVLSAVSGGVDSSVATALAYQAVGEKLSAVFIDHGLLRKGERAAVEKAFRKSLEIKSFTTVDASGAFLARLAGITDPELKRRLIGETFIRTFEQEAARHGRPHYLVQGTIYPDVIESRGPERSKAERIKTHHNVGGLPAQMDFELVEPLRYLFKDEVRAVGEALGLPAELVWRQPFPGPGLAVRCLGAVTAARLETLREADAIFVEELTKARLLGKRAIGGEERIAQAFAVLLPIRSVGVMGDQRTYQEVVALRAVTSEDFMTAGWAILSPDLLSRVASRIINEVKGVNRVVYDITSKPPATIEWE
jgi:GMP synthase (glutamine-hydrolysing)